MRTILTVLGAAVVVGLLAFVGSPSAASAAEVFTATLNIKCADRVTVRAQLESDFEEVVVGLGITIDEQIVFELWLSPDGSSWTFILTDTEGITCMAGNGKDWQQLDQTILRMLKPKGDPT